MEFQTSLPASYQLPPHAVRFWYAEFQTFTPFIRTLDAVLAPEERERAHRFANETLTRRYIITQSLLRHILGRTLSVPPASLVYIRNAYGKPSLNEKHKHLRFNVSHTHHAVLIATADQIDAGVDVEIINDPGDLMGIAKYMFPPDAVGRLAASRETERLTLFFRFWTRLEAAAKALGVGLGAVPPLNPVGSAPMSFHYQDREWHIQDLDLPSPGRCPTAAAVCLDHPADYADAFFLSKTFIESTSDKFDKAV